MASLNIRLTPEDARVVAELREDNVNVSELLRIALHEAARKRHKKNTVWTKKRIDELFARLNAISGPEPDWVSQGVNIRDRKSMSAYIRSKLSKEHGNLTELR